MLLKGILHVKLIEIRQGILIAAKARMPRMVF